VNLTKGSDRIENPKANADGITPERDDYRLALGLGVDR
jgi:hypothetical protein